MAPVFCQLCAQGYALAPITRSPDRDYGVNAKNLEGKRRPVDVRSSLVCLGGLPRTCMVSAVGNSFIHMFTMNHHLAEENY